MSIAVETYQQKAYGDWKMKLAALSCIAFCILSVYLVMSSEVINDCNEVDDCKFLAAFAILFLTAGLWSLWLWRISSIKWNDAFIEYRSMTGKKIRAPFSALVNIRRVAFLNGVCVEFDSYPKMLLSAEVKNYDAAVNDITKNLIHKFPYRFYVPALRDMIDNSDEAGCLSCKTPLSINQIADWKTSDKQMKPEDDFAICPICKSDDAVICNVSVVPITAEGLQKCNSKIEIDFDDLEIVGQQRSRLALNT